MRGGDLREGVDDSLSLWPADLERLVQVLVDHERERPTEAQSHRIRVSFFVREAAKVLSEPAGFLLGQVVRAGADEDRDVANRADPMPGESPKEDHQPPLPRPAAVVHSTSAAASIRQDPSGRGGRPALG
jgi:hypothetical protein